MTPAVVRLTTEQGPAEVLVHEGAERLATVVLTHGAGGDVDAPDLAGLADALPDLGFAVALVRMPWRVAGKKLAPRPQVIDDCYAEVLSELAIDTTLVVGGRSAGARSACRIAREHGASGVLALSFPLHPPGRPERSRFEELAGSGVATLVLQGERDPFGRPEEFPADLAADLVVVPAADHSLRVPKRADISQAEATLLVVEAAQEWLEREVRPAAGPGIDRADRLFTEHVGNAGAPTRVGRDDRLTRPRDRRGHERRTRRRGH